MKWGANTLQNTVEAQKGPVFSLFGDGNTIVGGGKDGKVLLLNEKLEILKAFDIREVGENRKFFRYNLL